jgi:hypothetical protein
MQEVQDELKLLDEGILNKLGEPISMDRDFPDYFNDINGKPENNSETPSFEPVEEAMPEADDFDAEAFDKYIEAEVILPKGDQYLLGTITARKHDIHGNPLGRGNSKPIFDSRVYQVKFPYGHTQEFSTTNTIAHNQYSQLDNEGNQFLLLDKIINYQMSDNAIDNNNRFQVSHNGNLHPRRTTKGWRLCVTWKDGSTSWETLKDLKEAYPVQVAEFAVSRGLADHVAFRWWVPFTLKHAARIIKSVKSCIQKTQIWHSGSPFY